MSKPDHPDIKGCTDGGCIFGHPGGMHTNGGCSCLKAIRSTFPAHGLRIERNIRLLRQEIESLKHALGHVLACSGAAGCVECRKLITGVLKIPATQARVKDDLGS